MHIFDVEESIGRADAHGLRHAFRILTRYPHEGHIEEARTPARLTGLFEAVTLALEGDQAAMPEPVSRAIETIARVPVEPDASYSHGAIIASEFRAHWHAVFCEHSGPSRATAGAAA